MTERHGITFTTHKERMDTFSRMFTREVTDHQMTVLLDQGTYRHLRSRQTGSGLYWFDLITWPGTLTIRGDMGTYVFASVEDMFGFFRSHDGYINPGYWNEKVQAADRSGKIRDYDYDALCEEIATRLDDYEGDKLAEIVAEIHDYILDTDSGTEESAMTALEDFESNGFEFSDAWEMEPREYTLQFIWCLHAIVWGINRYDELKAGAAR